MERSKAQKEAEFDPDGVGNTGANIFGLPFTTHEADVVIIPAPWDVTVSNSEGTWQGPEMILKQSPQIDLFDEIVHAPWKAGIAMEEIPQEIVSKNKILRKKAKQYISQLEENPQNQDWNDLRTTLDEINLECDSFYKHIYSRVKENLANNKLVVLVGGDHSTPLGLMQALGEQFQEFGILHLDAHADLRDAYMGFTHSHASIMFNAEKIKSVKSIVQVGLRDVCQQEVDLIRSQPGRFYPFFARDISKRVYDGEPWGIICNEIIDKLPQKVYISFDIDCLEPSHCPNTGTPVPGGLSYSAALYLLEKLISRQKTIIGFDLVETGPGDIDGVVACRLLYKTIALMLRSNHKA
jgi:agmatinase